MKPAKATFALIAVLTGILASEPVLAKGGRGSGRSGAHSGSHSRSHHTPARVIVGSAVILPYYYPPYYAPPVTIQPQPWGYIEQGSDAYYCAESQQYFPDAQECASAWQLVTPSPVPPT